MPGRKDRGVQVPGPQERATSEEPRGKGHQFRAARKRPSIEGPQGKGHQCSAAKKGPPVQCRKERATSAATACDHMKMEEELGFVCAAICFALTVVFVR